jgi:recombinational DNA repair protein RecR
MRDLSDDKQFIFSVECTVCNKNWISKPIYFSKAGEPSHNNAAEIVYKTLYMKEKHQAKLKAVDQAMLNLNFCPVCKTVICDSCFMICDDIDMCVDCARVFEETGELVEV